MTVIRTSSLFSVLFLAGIHWAEAQQAHVNLDWNPQKNTQNLVPFGASVISPEVRDDHTITFRLKAPDAKQVMLTGGPILLALAKKDPIPFRKDTDSLWTLIVGPVKAGYLRLQVYY